MNGLMQIVTALVALVGAGTSIFLAIERWQNRHTPVKELEIREDEAADAHWRGMLATQLEVIVEPMRDRINEQGRQIEAQGVEIRELRAEMETTRAELGATRTRYWRAIQHIRGLNAWIARHMPTDVAALPAVPAVIAEDI